MRIFLGLTEVSGYFTRLSSGLRDCGVDVMHVSLHQHRFGYSDESRPWIVRISQTAVDARIKAQASGNRIAAITSLLAVTGTRFALFVWAVLRFDIFIMGAGSSFFGGRELPLLRRLGKTVIYTLHGTDARPPYIDGFFDPSHYGIAVPEPVNIPETPGERAARLSDAHVTVAAARSQFVRRIERHSNYVICSPSYSQFLTKPFINFLAIGLPSTVGADHSEPLQKRSRVTILHAPSHLEGKGTLHIRAMIDRLRARGNEIEYVEIAGRPNAEVIAEIQRSDIIIDQYYSDSPMAGFAAEAAFFGKPVVVGGYYAANVGKDVAAELIPPTCFCLPEQMEREVERLLLDPAARQELGARARDYVTVHWNSKAVAGKFLQLLDGAPADWLVDPNRVTYLDGIGLKQIQAKKNIRAIVSRYGLDGLSLDGKANLLGLSQQISE